MRSTKNRSRSKGNRNRSVGNVVNRVFDSSGPEGKVRGTPQQIIDKYSQLMRDAQLSGDRVAAENFAQHSEHYTRMLAEAQREQDQRNQQQQQDQPTGQSAQNQQGGQQHGGQQQGGQQQGGQQQGGHQPRAQTRDNDRDRDTDRAEAGARPEAASPETAQPPTGGEGGLADPIETGSGEDPSLVETPEDKPRSRRRRKPKTKDGDDKPATDSSGEPKQAAE